MSAIRHIQVFARSGMTGSDLRKYTNQPIVGLSLLAFLAAAVPLPSQAQVPTFSPGTSSEFNNNSPSRPSPGVPSGVNNLPAPPPLAVPRPVNNFPSSPSSVAAPAPTYRLPPDTPYTLGAGDRVKVDVFDIPEYTGEFAVLVDGTLNLPVIGTVPVRGFSLQEASREIENRYRRYVRNPRITLSLTGIRPITLAVAGEVNRPGTYTVGGSGGGGAAGAAASVQSPTVTQAITLAGGITQSAAVGNVIIRRRIGTATQPEEFTVNLWELLRQGNISQDIALRDGDTIVIPTVTAVNPSDTRQLADASFASKEVRPINIAIVGEVARPGPYAITGGGEGTGGATGAVTGGATGVGGGGGGSGGPPTVTKAIQVAGGITSLADVREITIRRNPRVGDPLVVKVNLWELLRGGDASQDVILQEGDTITIPTATALDPAEANQLAGASFAPNTIVVNVVGEVTRPGAIPVPPNTPLNQAILAAGGFNVRASKRTVNLVRLNPNGTVTKRDVDVDLAQGINESNNPTLRNNDVVVVRRSTLATVGDTLGTVLNPVGSFLNIFSIFRTLGGN